MSDESKLDNKNTPVADTNSGVTNAKASGIEAKDIIEEKKKKRTKGVSNTEVNKKLQTQVVTSKKSRLHGRKKTIFFVAVIFLGASLLFTGGVFGVLSFIQENSMRITVDRSQLDALALYSDASFSRATTMMNVRGPTKMDNITYSWLPEDIGDYNGGSHNGDNYIAFTFYIRNDGSENITYESEIVFKEITKNMDAAMRVMVIENGERTVYAKARANGDPEPISDNFDMLATPFESEERIMSVSAQNIEVGQANKYTVVVWLEGEDADCNDSILGGWITIEMRFNSVDA